MIKQLLSKLFIHKKNLLVVTLGQMLATLGTLFGVRILTEFISPALFGEYKLLLSGISLITGIFIRPFTQFSMREYHDAEKKGYLHQFVIQVRYILRTYIFLILLSFGTAISLYLYHYKYLSVLTIVMILTTFALINAVEFERALFVTSNKQTYASMVKLTSNWLIPLTITATVVLTNKESITILFTSTVVILAIIYLVQRKDLFFTSISTNAKSLAEDRGTIIRSALRFGFPLAGVGLLSWLVHESDRFFLAYYHTESVVGIYSAAYGLVSAPFTLAAGSMAQFLYPIMFRVSAANDHKKRMLVMKAMLITTSVISLFGVVLISIFDAQITSLALGKSYRDGASKLLPWIAIAYSCVAISFSFDLSAYGSKRTLSMLVAYGTSAITNVVLNIILIPNNGAMGAVIATLISLFCYLTIMASLFFYKERHVMSSANSTPKCN